ncbi:hypothetical protein CPC08DRAFT_723367 [Agrocybe pediades]|nr:hypothetical protein CPC08DRAFT_723367 [Agrocybe pediades]
MAVFGIWPGLPLVRFNRKTIQTRRGVNWMAYTKPLLLALAYKKGSADIRDNFTPALLVWRTSEHTHWLLFDKDEPELQFGRVLIITYPELPAYYPTLEMYDRDDVPFFIEDFPDWITYLQHRWDTALTRPPPLYASSVLVVHLDLPVNYVFSGFNPQVLLSMSWTDHQASRFLDDVASLLP